MSSIKRIIMRALPVDKVEVQATYIIHGQPLTRLLRLLNLPDAKVTNISRRDNELGIYIPPRDMSLTRPLSSLLGPLGLQLVVEFYDVAGNPVYFINEPPVDEVTKYVYVALRERVAEAGAVKPSELLSIASEMFSDIGLNPNAVMMDTSVKSAIYYVYRDLAGYGPLEVPMNDPYVEEVSWYAYDQMVQVVDKKVTDTYPNAEFIYTNMFIDPEMPDFHKKFVMTQVVRSITSRGRVGLTVAKPIAETRIPDPTGIGFHRLAAHLDVVSRSPAVTIRKFPQKKLSLTELIKYGTLTSFEAAYLLLQLINRGFVLIVGGMGSGKTTLLQALISALPTGYKIVTIEDTPELSTPTPNWHPLYVRRAPRESELEDVDFSRLVIHSLRHRATAVTLGEVRGKEMADLVQAAASGHGAICLPAGTPVVARRPGGRPTVLTIKELVERHESGEDWEVYSFDYRMRSFKWSRVTGSIRVHTDKWIEIRTDRGRRLRATPDHRIPVLVNGDIVVKEFADLRPGDMVIVSGETPRDEELKAVLCCDIMVTLQVGMGVLFAAALMHRRTVRLPLEYRKLLDSIPLPIKYRVEGDTVVTRSTYVWRLVDAILAAIKERPFAAPRWLMREAAHAIGREVILQDEETANALAYAFRSAGVDAYADGKTVKIVGDIEAGYWAERVTEVREIPADEESYDIEVEGTHSFVTGPGLVSNNCTFHSDDPNTVLIRITSPPINVSPESLTLITSIVNVARTKTYVGGKPRHVRRVIRIFEITDVKGMNVKSETVFKWNPMRDLHNPQLSVKGLVELWRKSRTVRTIGYNLYVDEAPRILVTIYVLARYLDKLVERGVLDIKQLAYAMSSFYLKLDYIVEDYWRRYFKQRLSGLQASAVPAPVAR